MMTDQVFVSSSMLMVGEPHGHLGKRSQQNHLEHSVQQEIVAYEVQWENQTCWNCCLNCKENHFLWNKNVRTTHGLKRALIIYEARLKETNMGGTKL